MAEGSLAPILLSTMQAGVETTGALAQSRYESGVARQNAAFAEMQGADARERGEREAQLHMQKTRQLIGSQQAAMAAQGLDVGTGSAADVQADTARLGALDAQTIRNNAAREAWGYRSQAADYRSRAKFSRIAGRQKAFGSILSGGMRFAQMYQPKPDEPDKGFFGERYMG